MFRFEFHFGWISPSSPSTVALRNTVRKMYVPVFLLCLFLYSIFIGYLFAWFCPILAPNIVVKLTLLREEICMTLWFPCGMSFWRMQEDRKYFILDAVDIHNIHSYCVGFCDFLCTFSSYAITLWGLYYVCLGPHSKIQFHPAKVQFHANGWKEITRERRKSFIGFVPMMKLIRNWFSRYIIWISCNSLY